VLNGPASSDLTRIEPVPATEREKREPAVVPTGPDVRRV
jgi:hypothetical protein